MKFIILFDQNSVFEKKLSFSNQNFFQQNIHFSKENYFLVKNHFLSQNHSMEENSTLNRNFIFWLENYITTRKLFFYSKIFQQELRLKDQNFKDIKS